jgi:hypothetical protein
VLTDTVIALNGNEDYGDAHESFCLHRDAGNNGSCCKTARKPYDDVVTAILIRAAQLLGNEYMEGSGWDEMGSDGEWDEWAGGRKLVKKVFPVDEVVRPWKD